MSLASAQPSPRVLVVGPLPPPAGGMANQTAQLLRLLRGEGIPAEAVNMQAPYRPAWAGRLRGLRALFRLVPFLFSVWAASGRAGVVHVMANSGWSWHLMAAPAIRIARLRGRPVIVNYRGGLAREFLARSARRVLPALRHTTLVVPSRFLQQVFASHGATAQVIPNVVDLQRFHPAAVRPTPAGPHLVVPRALEHIYGNDLALRAVALLKTRHPQLRLSIAGEGPHRASLEQLARELAIAANVSFVGRITPEEMASLLREADVVVNPVRADNMPNSVLEALACGVPVVSTSVGGIPWLVEHARNAWLVEPESPQALADGISHVLGSAELRAQLVAEGQRLARACSWPVVREQWLRTYQSAAGRAG